MDASAEFYQAVIDEHRRRPRNRGPLPTANRVARRENPRCGDLCTIQLEVNDGRIAAAAFTGAGCALSQAGASLATATLSGRSETEARALVAAVETLVRDDAPAAPADEIASALGDAAALAAARAFPARHDCALLAWRAVLDALDQAPA